MKNRKLEEKKENLAWDRKCREGIYLDKITKQKNDTKEEKNSKNNL